MEISILWLFGSVFTFILMGSLLLFEIGFTTEKNINSIAVQKLIIYATSIISFWVVGYSIAFGESLWGFMGRPSLFFIDSTLPDVGVFQFFFHTTLVSISTSIVGGALTERTKTSVYIFYSIVFSGLIYPIIVHWSQADGWLSSLGYIDGGGVSFMHIASGAAAFVGALIVGPRIGKYKNNQVKAIPGDHLYFGVLAIMLAWTGWSALNLFYARMVNGTGIDDPTYLANLLIAPAFSTLTTLLLTINFYKKPDISLIINGTLAGIVAISAGFYVVSALGALIIGIVTGLVVVALIDFIDKVLKVDDPLGVTAVHGIAGIIGLVFTGLLATDGGLFTGGGSQLLIEQLMGIVTVVAFVGITMAIVFTVINVTRGLRLSSTEETIGKDASIYSIATSYGGLASVSYGRMPVKEAMEPVVELEVSSDLSDAMYEETKSSFTKNESVIRRFEIITNPDRLERLTQELNEIGVTGMNVTMITGFGVQRGHASYYRGVEVTSNFLPKIKLETIVSTVATADMLDAIKKALYTGHIGDGKVFISEVLHVVRVSTGERDKQALLYPDEALYKKK